MKKHEQLEINKNVDSIIAEINSISNIEVCMDCKQLRACQAWVYKFGRFYLLRSYNTFVAAIDTWDDTCYDFLRKVYGYTATSAQHISKFKHDYGAGTRGCTYCFTWREA